MITKSRTGVTAYETPTDRDVVITRVVAAPRAVVFDAWTNPRHVPRWMTGPEGWTMPVCEIDLRPGGKWHFVWRKSDGSEMDMTGTYREVVPPERLVHTESWGPEWPETTNTLVLEESAGHTTITLTVRYPSREARDAALKTGMKDGMDQSYANLDRLLGTLV
jgi:uncharacterized protein YndB with AHSA1/START domain